MIAYKQIWTDEARGIVKDNWAIMGPLEIRGLVIGYCKDRAAIANRDSYQIVTLGGILYQALDMDLIGEEEYDELKKAYRRKPMPTNRRMGIIRRDGYKCLNCGSGNRLQVDHIKPLFVGGSDANKNLQTLCRVCHKIKGMNTLDIRKMDAKIMFEGEEDGPIYMRVGTKKRA